MAKSSMLIGLLLVFFSSAASGQQNRYMVFFKDKTGNPFSVSQPQEFLSPLAIQRRVKHDVAISEQDLPVNPAYITAVRNAGADVYFQSRWMNGVLVQCEPNLVAVITELESVDRMEMVAPQAKLISNGRKKVVDRQKSTRSNGVTDVQLKMLGLDQMHQENIKGEGVIIALLDSGFDGVDVTGPFEHIFQEDRINLDVSKDFVYNSDNVFQHDDHGSQVFSVIAGFQPGTFTGGAYKASYQLYVTEEVPTEYRVEEYNWLFAAERADSAGADIIQSSLGYYDFDISSMDYQTSQMNGNVTVVSRAAKWAADRGIIVVVSAGNEGNVSWKIITAPADAEDVLAVASVDASLKRANSSSIGPSSDLRIKPDVAALGVATSVVEKTGNMGKSSGTSLAAPLITSLVAGILERYPAMTNREIIEAIRLSASQGSNPDNLIGYGIPHYKAVVNYLESRIQEHEFEVYPNPFGTGTDSLVIRPKDPGQASDCVIEIVSAEGKSVLNANPLFSWQNNVYSPDMTNFAPGLYFLRIGSGGKKYTYKLIKK